MLNIGDRMQKEREKLNPQFVSTVIEKVGIQRFGRGIHFPQGERERKIGLNSGY